MISLFVNKEKAKERYNICKECENYSNKFCKNCSCFLPAKVILAATKCPIDKWTGESTDPNIIKKYTIEE